MFKVHIDIGRLVAFAAHKALEHQVAAYRIDLRNVQAVTHDRIGRRATPLAQNLLAACKAHDVVHGQEIHLVLQVGNQGQFAL